MTLNEAAHSAVQSVTGGWSIDKRIPIFTIGATAISVIPVLIAAIIFVNNTANSAASNAKDIARVEREVERLSGIPERMVRIETKMDKANEKADQANLAHVQTLSKIQELLEIRAYAPPPVPKRAVVRRPAAPPQ